MTETKRQDEHSGSPACSLRLDMRNLWPVVLPSPFGYGGDWSKTPLGEILDGNRMRDSGFKAKCRKYNCHCEMDHT